MKLAKPYKLTWYFFVIFVLVVLAFGSYVYFSKGKIFKNVHTEGLSMPSKKNKKGSTSCDPGYEYCTVMAEQPYPLEPYCYNTCVTKGTCGATPPCPNNPF